MLEQEKQLIASALCGNDYAFGQLLKNHERRVFTLIIRMVWHKETAEDLAQESFWKAWKNLKQFNTELAFGPWINRIAINTALDWLRKKKKEFLGTEATDIDDLPEEHEPAIEEQVASEEVEAALGKLPSHYRSVITLHYLEGYSYEETAKLMKIPIGTIRTYIHRAKKQMKNFLTSTI